jgi:hypothetical protein
MHELPLPVVCCFTRHEATEYDAAIKIVPALAGQGDWLVLKDCWQKCDREIGLPSVPVSSH